jgi:hypothetical protein
MDKTVLLKRVKTALRISHDALDADIQADIDACLADLKMCGVVFDADAGEPDALIFNAVKLYCRATYTDDTVKGAELLRRYDALKGSLMLAGEYKGAESDA